MQGGRGREEEHLGGVLSSSTSPPPPSSSPTPSTTLVTLRAVPTLLRLTWGEESGEKWVEERRGEER